MKILVAGFGNVLREDDGFGVFLAQRLEKRTDLAAGVDVLDVGIGGISMVQDLMGGYDALIVLDALEGDTPGQVKTLIAEVPDAKDVPKDYLTDVHFAEPGRAMVLAKAMNVLPETVYIIGAVVQVAELGEGLTPVVEAALDTAEKTVINLLNDLTTSVGATLCGCPSVVATSNEGQPHVTKSGVKPRAAPTK